MSFHGRQHFVCCHNSFLWELNKSCATPLGGDSWKLEPCFLWSSSHAPFPCANFVLCPFVVISHNHQYNYMNLPSKSSNLEVFLRTYDTHCDKQICIVFFTNIYLGPPESKKLSVSWRKCPLTLRVILFPPTLSNFASVWTHCCCVPSYLKYKVFGFKLRSVCLHHIKIEFFRTSWGSLPILKV